jgi:uncharacterized protein
LAVDQDDAIRDLLRTARNVAVVGLSPREARASNEVGRYLQEKGFRIFPVNPGHESLLGERAYSSLSQIPESVHIVDIFMRAERVLSIVEEAITLKPRAIWLQLGIRNDEARALCAARGILFVMDRCIKREHARLFPPSRP